ncbi:MAG: LysE family translocator [Candidatus Aminicenantes bacterium RBG_16_66_30]
MKSVYLFLLAIGLGFVTAIPVGGSQIEAAKRAIHGHLGAAWMVVLGSVSSDIMYGVIALFGIAPFLDIPWVMAAFSAVGAVVLWILAYMTFRESRKPHHVRMDLNALKSKRWAYVTGFSLAVTNPPMILTWLYGVTLAKHLGLATPFTTQAKAIFIAGGALGLGGYLAGLSLIMFRIKHFIPLKAIGKVYYWLGIGLFVLSFFFVYNFVRIILKMGPAVTL